MSRRHWRRGAARGWQRDYTAPFVAEEEDSQELKHCAQKGIECPPDDANPKQENELIVASKHVETKVV
jgi:hypothetical protein